MKTSHKKLLFLTIAITTILPQLLYGMNDDKDNKMKLHYWSKSAIKKNFYNPDFKKFYNIQSDSGKTGLSYCLGDLGEGYSLEIIKWIAQKSDVNTLDNHYKKNYLEILMRRNHNLNKDPYYDDIIKILLQAGLEQNSITTTTLDLLHDCNFVYDKTIKLLLELGISTKASFNATHALLIIGKIDYYDKALRNNDELYKTIEAYEPRTGNTSKLALWLANYADKKYLISIFRRATACNHRPTLFYLGKLNKECSPINALAFAAEYNRTDAIPYILSSFSPGTIITLYKKILGKKTASKVYAGKIFELYEYAKKLGCKEFISKTDAYCNNVAIIKMLERQPKTKDVTRLIMQFLYEKEDFNLLIKNIKK